MPPTDVNQALNFGGRRGGYQGRCDRRSEAFVKFQKKYSFLGGEGEGVRVDVNG